MRQVWEGTSPRWAGAPPHKVPRRLGFEEGAPPPDLGGKFPPLLPWPPPRWDLGLAAAPRGGGSPQIPSGWRPQGEEGEAHLGWALGPICPRVCPLPLLEAPWALVGGAPAHLGAGPFPLLAHVGLRGWWPHLVDPRTPSVVPVHYR